MTIQVLRKLLQDTIFGCVNLGLLKMSSRAVAVMRRPAVRLRLQTELAALPQALLSYQELLAFYIDNGSKLGLLVLKMGDTAAYPDIRAAARLAAELLPQLVPDNPRFRFAAALASHSVSPGPHAPAATAIACYLKMLPAALNVAQQQGSDYFTALCGYQMAIDVEDWVFESAMQQGLPPPSAVLGWLQQAEAAHRLFSACLPAACPANA